MSNFQPPKCRLSTGHAKSFEINKNLKLSGLGLSHDIMNLNIIKELLPEHYFCKETKGGINCKSNIGMNDSLYTAFIDCIKEIFKGEFKEVFHQVCTQHLQFTVFIKS